MGRLVEGGVVETDREALHVARGELGHHRRHRAGVDPAREEDANGHVADQLEADGLAQGVDELAGGGFEADRGGRRLGRREVHVPIRLHGCGATLLIPGHVVAWGQLVDALKDRVRAGDVAERG